MPPALSDYLFIPRPYEWAWSLNYPQVEGWVTTGKGSPKHCVLPALCVQEASYVTFLGNSVFPCHSTFPSNPLTKYICSFCKRNVGGGRETPGKKWAQAGRAGAAQELVSKPLVEQMSRKGIPWSEILCQLKVTMGIFACVKKFFPSPFIPELLSMSSLHTFQILVVVIVTIVAMLLAQPSAQLGMERESHLWVSWSLVAGSSQWDSCTARL